MIYQKLQEFRKSIYEYLGTAKDTVFELMDAVLTSPSISSYVSLSMLSGAEKSGNPHYVVVLT